MTLWLYRYRWFLTAFAICSCVTFVATIHFRIEAGKTELVGDEVYLMLACWWGALIPFYAWWLVETLHGKSKNKSSYVKSVAMAFPTFFVIMAIYVSSKFIGAV